MMAVNADQKKYVFIGSYTQKESFVNGKSTGIAIYRFDSFSGQLHQVGTVPAGINPTFLTVSADHQFLYAVNEVTGGSGENGWATAFAVDSEDGNLRYLNRQSTQGLSPCHLCLTKNENFLAVANYESGSICLMPRLPDGLLEPPCDWVTLKGCGPHFRQKAPHAHMVIPTPSGKNLLAVDLGSDQIWWYRLDELKGRLIHASPFTLKMPAGSGPRHLAFHPNGKFAYVLGELDSTVTFLRYDDERFHIVESISTLPVDYRGENTGAAIQVAPSGKFLYTTNRGHNSLTIFSIQKGDGRIGLLDHYSTFGQTPRHFYIDDRNEFLFVANQDSDSVVIFRINPGSGKLSKITSVNTPTPACIQLI
jgi:6-phosphogluconolactonase